MEPADAEAVYAVSLAAFQDLDTRLRGRPEPPGPASGATVRVGRLQRTDPGGAWVAERDGEIVGGALAIVREGVWGLSLLVVRPDAQSGGAGRELLARA
jgi:GNAT superfamily N-acetyltransferase